VSNAADPWVQLRLLRELTRSTGALHEAQVTQLKYWPRLTFPNSVSSEFEYQHEARSLVFRVTIPWWKRSARNQKTRLEGLVRSVRDMLGSDMTVRVERGDGTAIFESTASAEPSSCPKPT